MAVNSMTAAAVRAGLRADIRPTPKRASEAGQPQQTYPKLMTLARRPLTPLQADPSRQALRRPLL
ncbi:MAG: hypothetical protein RMK31_04875 [Candidatus Caldarchaeum sp.]|nr:hypothetical protein [Candidatus Caldarchaeum sp.]MDW7978426.1 hypothetical protein [Candidatus Caldarchaeum sp.]MDW8359905.1 hypothetical protein [Candidatus Caldarchaeum sp.]